MWVPIRLETVGTLVMGRQHQFGMTTGGVPLGVGDLGIGNVDVAPAGTTEPIPEVDILHVHEVARVETVDRVEGGAAQQQARSGQPAHLAFGDRLVVVPSRA